MQKLKKVITPSNLGEHKMSVLFESVLDDLNKVQKLGIGLYMSSWSTVDVDVCTVCLGGAACLGFVPTSKIDNHVVGQICGVYTAGYYGRQSTIDGLSLSVVESFNIHHMMQMFDSFRKGDYFDMVDRYNRFAVKEVNCDVSEFPDCYFSMDIKDGELELLKNTIKLLIKHLKSQKC